MKTLERNICALVFSDWNLRSPGKCEHVAHLAVKLLLEGTFCVLIPYFPSAFLPNQRPSQPDGLALCH